MAGVIARVLADDLPPEHVPRATSQAGSGSSSRTRQRVVREGPHHASNLQPLRFVLVDYKDLAGTLEEAITAAAGYGGQIAAYAEAIEAATRKRVRERGESCWGGLAHQGRLGL